MNFKGTLSPKNVLLEILLEAATLNLNKVIFTYPEPLPEYPVMANYVGRMLFVLNGKTDIFGSDGNVIGKRTQTSEDITFTGENCWAGANHILPYTKTVSAVFMSNCIRIVAAEFKNGRIIANPYFHTAKPAGSKAGGMLQALNLIIYDHEPERDIKALYLLKALLLETIDEVKKDVPHVITKSEQTYKFIKDYIDHNYQMPINRNDICHELGFNPCYVSRLFRKYNGDKINNYLEQCRMKKARLMLKNFNITIARVATQCGYSSEAYFIKAFKKFYNTTPGEFRNKNLAE
jgi:AraC-like DNA-binding protein